MQNLWSDSDAKAAIAQHATKGIGDDLALRVYTTRLLGGEPRLVLHGGGNTSVKTKVADITGSAVDVLCVKGSGWDMGTIEAPGLPAVRLEPLRELVGLQALSDEDMVNVQRCNLLDSKSPNPSVETHRRQPGRLDRAHVPAAALHAQHVDRRAGDVRHLGLHRGVAAAMQHQPRLAAQQARRVDAQREVLADALGGVLGDRGLGVAVGPEVLHG